jgi:hypothetical protein
MSSTSARTCGRTRARDERVELDAQGAAPGREEEGKPLKPSGERLAGNPEWRASD